MTPIFFDFDHVIDARAAFAEKQRRDELLRDNPFALLVGMAFAAPVHAAAWTLLLSSFFWTL